MDDLKVFDRGLCDPAMEVEHIGLGVVVPHGGLVVQLDHTLCVFVLPSGQQGFVVLHRESGERVGREETDVVGEGLDLHYCNAPVLTD